MNATTLQLKISSTYPPGSETSGSTKTRTLPGIHSKPDQKPFPKADETKIKSMLKAPKAGSSLIERAAEHLKQFSNIYSKSGLTSETSLSKFIELYSGYPALANQIIQLAHDKGWIDHSTNQQAQQSLNKAIQAGQTKAETTYKTHIKLASKQTKNQIQQDQKYAERLQLQLIQNSKLPKKTVESKFSSHIPPNIIDNAFTHLDAKSKDDTRVVKTPSDTQDALKNNKKHYLAGIRTDAMLGYHEATALATMIKRPIGVVRQNNEGNYILESVFKPLQASSKPPVFVSNNRNYHFKGFTPTNPNQAYKTGDIILGRTKESEATETNDCFLNALETNPGAKQALADFGNHRAIREKLAEQQETYDLSFYVADKSHSPDEHSPKTYTSINKVPLSDTPQLVRINAEPDTRGQTYFWEQGYICNGKKIGLWESANKRHLLETLFNNTGDIISHRIIGERKDDGSISRY